MCTISKDKTYMKSIKWNFTITYLASEELFPTLISKTKPCSHSKLNKYLKDLKNKA